MPERSLETLVFEFRQTFALEIWMGHGIIRLWIGILLFMGLCVPVHSQTGSHARRWTGEKANHWYIQQPWLVGSNYLPANAINELEMWQPDTFDPELIDKELAWAESIGLNTMRVFLHDLLWKQDPRGFTKRIGIFLAIAEKHHIRPLLVLFDSCWDPNPKLGAQRKPTPGIHNSGWVQSPGGDALVDVSQYPRLEAYVKGVVGAFANDNRVLGWDVWNEPDGFGLGNYKSQEPKDKVALVLALLPRVYDWARSVKPIQPLTSGVWTGNWSDPRNLEPMAMVQLEMSDILSFHNYGKPDDFKQHLEWLEQYHRPIICTEYMARKNGSTFQGILPIAKKYRVGAINWGFVAGKSQTYLPWDSWEHPYIDREPEIWFHEILRTDGTPYRAEEVAFLKEIIHEQ
jgi:hypothetical protein